ncbi:chaperonin family protein RbcX [Pannus brasiliensis CCIBt3594]|uniref:RuBisCO chaperone RbcX n=1 Tax=Pannus brasiliensis CCIBt3594 TaxID=1427578 RepID=A0AAW9QNN1_9CHRO
MYPKKVAEDTAKVLQSYLTYQAVRTIIDQLSETNPPLSLWLRSYTSSHSIQDGEAYIEGLMTENKELVLRIMTVREHLAEQVLEFLPEMVKTGIINANTDHRRQLLERLTRTTSSFSSLETSDFNPDVEDTPDS